MATKGVSDFSTIGPAARLVIWVKPQIKSGDGDDADQHLTRKSEKMVSEKP